MKRWLLLSLLITTLALTGCSSKSSKVQSQRTGIQLDYPSLWNVCLNVAKFRTSMDIVEQDSEAGHIMTDWRIEEGFEPYGTTKRKRVILDITPEENTEVESYTITLTVEAQESDDVTQTADMESIHWKRAREDDTTRKWLLQVIANRVNAIKENRVLGLPDPVFHDIRVGE